MKQLAFSIQNLMQNPFEYPLAGALPYAPAFFAFGATTTGTLQPSKNFNSENEISFVIKFLDSAADLNFGQQYRFKAIDFGLNVDFSIKIQKTNTQLIGGTPIYTYQIFVDNVFLTQYDSVQNNMNLNRENGNFELKNIKIGSIDFSVFQTNFAENYIYVGDIYGTDYIDYRFGGSISNLVREGYPLVILTNEKALKRLVQNPKTKLQKIRLISDSWLNVKNTKIIVQSYVVSDLVLSQLFHFPILPKQKQVITELNIDDLVLSAEKELILKVPPESTTNFLIS